MIFLKNNHSTKGSIAIYLVMLALTILLGASIGLAAIFLGRLQLVGSIDKSVKAFYAADTGIETLLRVEYCLDTYPYNPPVQRRDCIDDIIGIPVPGVCAGSGGGENRMNCRKEVMAAHESRDKVPVDGRIDNIFSSGATYTVCKDPASDCNIVSPGANCTSAEFCAKSVGSFEGTLRAVSIIE
ncbi:MAG: hypothetical protein HYW95_02155 [Candidatus Wildermuthbacteria bacterium]|nr:hypothetical protein [Candidatus Wildermuthbacteria bacterium]